MPLKTELLQQLKTFLANHNRNFTGIKNIKPVSGGDISEAWCVDTGIEKYMLKVNSRIAYPQMFAREAAGLEAIRQTDTIAVPAVIYYSDTSEDSFLLMEWIETRRTTDKGSVQLGQQLAQMHKHSAPYFGFEVDNYMGSLQQSNRKHENWKSFFAEERLMPLVKMAFDKHLLSECDIRDFNLLCNKLGELFDEEESSLIHGDLWGGNYLISADEKPYLIDPAVSYGHREFDLAMTTLFGGFSRSFYEAYYTEFPLSPNWQQRIDLWNLYPLLVHLILFGAGYLGQVRDGVGVYV